MASSQVREVPVEAIRCLPQVRARFSQECLTGLAQSLREVGFQQPIRVRREGDGWTVIDGERRLRAAKLAGLAVVPVLVEERELSEDDVVQRQLIGNCQREDLTPVEKARAIDRLMKSGGLPAARVAEKLGLSPASVSKLLTLLVLPPEVQAQVEAGVIAASTAYEVAKTREPKARARLAAAAAAGQLTRRRVLEEGATTRRLKSRPSDRRRIHIALGCGGTLAVPGRGLTPDGLMRGLEVLLQQLRALLGEGLSLRDAARRVSEESKGGNGHG